jgi:hypothetical protein
MIASAAVPWPALVEQFPNHHGVLFFELTCSCGDWRSAVPMDSESLRLACPRCGELHRAVILGRGLVQSDAVPWRLVSPALKRNRSLALGNRRMGRPRAAEVTSRVIVAANRLLQGRKPGEIARELGLSSSHYSLFLKRRRNDIDAELRRLTVSDAVMV